MRPSHIWKFAIKTRGYGTCIYCRDKTRRGGGDANIISENIKH